MTTVQLTERLWAPVTEVWRVIGGFGAFAEWHPAVQSSELHDGGRVRHLKLKDGGVVVERLQSFSERDHSYVYSIEEGPLPVAKYLSKISVRAVGEGSGAEVEWSSELVPSGAPEPEAAAIIRGIYQAGLENLKRRFGT
jgi:hypothetical protein